MKLKIKIPLLFLFMFLFIVVSGAIYLNILVGHKKPAWSGSEHVQLFLFLFVIAGFMFSILTIYFHFNITKPIQILNIRLNNLSIGRTITSLYSKRTDEIGELYNHFNEMEERLHQAHKGQLDMMAAIAHDLKTPLTTINGFVELLATQKNLSEREKQEYYELILKKSKHIKELINSFSEFTKGELELETIEKQPLEVFRLFENIATEYETELSGFGFELNWKHSFGESQYIMINEHMIRRVIGNIFSNAVRYGDKKELKVYMSGYVSEGYAYFKMEDNGVGVPENELSSLFLKFYTIDKARQSKNEGVGLGLASCKSIIEHHGGKICVFHSEYGGLGIQFTLPLSL